MSENEISLIRQKIKTLEAKKFDLEAWKAPTLIFLSRIFGPSSELVRQIRELKYDYSSWSLRDTSGGIHQTDPVRTRAKEILEAAITELESFNSPAFSAPQSDVLDALKNELTGRDMDELNKILILPANEKRDRLKTFLSAKEKDLLVSVLVEHFLSLP